MLSTRACFCFSEEPGLPARARATKGAPTTQPTGWHKRSSEVTVCRKLLSPDEKWIYSKKKRPGKLKIPAMKPRSAANGRLWSGALGRAPVLRDIDYLLRGLWETSRKVQPQSSQPPASSRHRLLSWVLAPCFEGADRAAAIGRPSGRSWARKPMGGENET